jgi:pre-rRNA-processing protein TSR1
MNDNIKCAQVLFALCASVDLESLADDLFALLSKHSSSTVLPGPLTPTIHSSQYRATISVRSSINLLIIFPSLGLVYGIFLHYCYLLLQVLKAPHGDLLSCMEMLKVSIFFICCKGWF